MGNLVIWDQAVLAGRETTGKTLGSSPHRTHLSEVLRQTIVSIPCRIRHSARTSLPGLCRDGIGDAGWSRRRATVPGSNIRHPFPPDDRVQDQVESCQQPVAGDVVEEIESDCHRLYPASVRSDRCCGCRRWSRGRRGRQCQIVGGQPKQVFDGNSQHLGEPAQKRSAGQVRVPPLPDLDRTQRNVRRRSQLALGQPPHGPSPQKAITKKLQALRMFWANFRRFAHNAAQLLTF